ncbi:N-ethylmaleimide reductase [Chryseobacterium soldanellicola]|uniref:N-ethylmaleimide reductase n=1 Tax=Chryseobacterium soldanellicola TaxID=311333 RepID=A0A1H1FBU5_9FLAO|nr:alkene reductase [Chryseobacterium soldanellicola]SDQ98387.1 N-ethylmaleimide reductase [Chryseobacterium soldanellicola]
MKLLENTQLRNLTLKNRMAMSAMTRSRADQDGIVGQSTVTYYTQRATAGLIFSEAIRISEDATGSPFTPGIFNDEQINAWRKVTSSVHDNGGIIIAQLWHTGRAGHSVDRHGKIPLAPSPLPIKGMQHFTSDGMKEYEVPQEMTTEEIRQTIKDYGQASKNAIEAGFDGVELHAANGYLPNQFLAESANKRTDDYGGSHAGKARFIVEVMEELINAVGGDRVGIKISPFHPYGDMILDNPVQTYTYLIEQLKRLDIAYVELMRKSPDFPSPAHYPEINDMEFFSAMIKHPVIANTGYDRKSAEAELIKGNAEMISFGTLFLANPDLPKRFEKNTSLNEPDRATMFGGDDRGYIDYPFLEKQIKSRDDQ